MPELNVAFGAAFLIVLAAGATAGLAGFGFSIVSVPILLLVYEPSTVIALNKILTLGTIWVVLIGSWRSISWSYLRRIVPVALIGLFIGVALLQALEPAAIKLIVGGVVIFFAVLLLRGGVNPVPERIWMAPVAGIFSGTLSTSTGMAGPPLVLFFTLVGVPVEVFRATSVCYFLLLDLVGFPTLILQGVVTRSDTVLALTLAPAAVIGRYLGSWLAPRISPLGFRRATLGLLLVAGAIAVGNVLLPRVF